MKKKQFLRYNCNTLKIIIRHVTLKSIAKILNDSVYYKNILVSNDPFKILRYALELFSNTENKFYSIHLAA